MNDAPSEYYSYKIAPSWQRIKRVDVQRSRFAVRRGLRRDDGLVALSCAFRSSSSIRHMPLINASRFREPAREPSHSILKEYGSEPWFSPTGIEDSPYIPQFCAVQLRRLPYARDRLPVQMLILSNLVHSPGFGWPLVKRIVLGVRDEINR